MKLIRVNLNIYLLKRILFLLYPFIMMACFAPLYFRRTWMFISLIAIYLLFYFALLGYLNKSSSLIYKLKIIGIISIAGLYLHPFLLDLPLNRLHYFFTEKLYHPLMVISLLVFYFYLAGTIVIFIYKKLIPTRLKKWILVISGMVLICLILVYLHMTSYNVGIDDVFNIDYEPGFLLAFFITIVYASLRFGGLVGFSVLQSGVFLALITMWYNLNVQVIGGYFGDAGFYKVLTGACIITLFLSPLIFTGYLFRVKSQVLRDFFLYKE